MPKIYSYSRVSTLEQLKGSGLDTQIDQAVLQQLSKEHNLPISESVMSDKGKSAYHGEHLNHELGAFLQAIKGGSVAPGSILVVYSLDRLSRLQLGYAKQIYLDLTNAGINIYATLDNHLYQAHNVADEIVSSIVFERAHNESSTKSKRTTGAAKKRIDDHIKGVRAEDGNAIPIRLGRLPWWVNSDNGSIKLDDYYAPIARELIDRTIAGSGLMKNLDWLNENYTPPKQNKNKLSPVWNNNSIAQMHKQRSLIGEYSIKLQGTEHQLEGYIPALITETTYYKLLSVKQLENTPTNHTEHIRINWYENNQV